MAPSFSLRGSSPRTSGTLSIPRPTSNSSPSSPLASPTSGPAGLATSARSGGEAGGSGNGYFPPANRGPQASVAPDQAMKAVKAMEEVLAAWNEHRVALSAAGKSGRKLAAALRDLGGFMDKTEIPAQTLRPAAAMIESVAEVTVKLAKRIDKEYDDVNSDASKYFTLLAKETRSQDAYLNAIGKKHDKAEKAYRKASKNLSDTSTAHAGLVALKDDLGADIDRANVDHMALIGSKQAALMFRFASGTGAVASAVVGYHSDALRKAGPAYRDVEYFRVLAEINWQGSIPTSLDEATELAQRDDLRLRKARVALGEADTIGPAVWASMQQRTTGPAVSTEAKGMPAPPALVPALSNDVKEKTTSPTVETKEKAVKAGTASPASPDVKALVDKADDRPSKPDATIQPESKARTERPLQSVDTVQEKREPTTSTASEKSKSPTQASQTPQHDTHRGTQQTPASSTSQTLPTQARAPISPPVPPRPPLYSNVSDRSQRSLSGPAHGPSSSQASSDAYPNTNPTATTTATVRGVEWVRSPELRRLPETPATFTRLSEHDLWAASVRSHPPDQGDRRYTPYGYGMDGTTLSTQGIGERERERERERHMERMEEGSYPDPRFPGDYVRPRATARSTSMAIPGLSSTQGTTRVPLTSTAAADAHHLHHSYVRGCAYCAAEYDRMLVERDRAERAQRRVTMPPSYIQPYDEEVNTIHDPTGWSATGTGRGMARRISGGIGAPLAAPRPHRVVRLSPDLEYEGRR